MNRLPTYCEVAFLDHFYKQRPSLDKKEDDYVEKWILLNKVIKSRCTLFINSYDEFQEKAKSNPNYLHLLKNSTTGDSEIINSDLNVFDYLGKALCLFLMSNNKEIGRCHIQCDLNNWVNIIEPLTYQSTYFISKGSNCTFKSWAELNINSRSPITGIIIADPYIMKDAVSLGNLKKILSAVLPKNQCINQLDVSIFINRGSDLDKLKKEHELLMTYFSTLHLPYATNLSIHQISNEDLHDRNILTNYTWLNSGHSFNYFGRNEKIKIKTTLNIKSIACDDNNSHISLIQDFAKLAENGNAEVDMVGNGKNNLYNI